MAKEGITVATPRRSLVLPLLKEIADELGLDLVIEPEYGFAAQLSLPSGERRYFRGTTFDLNPAGAVEIAKDKQYAAVFLRSMGYPVPEGEAFLTRRWAKRIGIDRGPDVAWSYARSLGLPVYVKPNSKSRGSGVSLAHTRREFFRAVTAASSDERVYVVQRRMNGSDFRLVVLDGDLISAYERRPLGITGDGSSTVRELIEARERAFRSSGRDTRLDPEEPRVVMSLRRAGLTVESILTNGQWIQLLPVANLSAGGEARDVTHDVHQGWRTLAAAICRDMNLRFAGIDIMTPESVSNPPGNYVVLEVNAAPGLDNYAAVGSDQAATVRQMYTRVLEALARAD